MSQHFEAKDIHFGKLTKKMSKKGNAQIPLDALGFKAKAFYDSAYQYVPRKKGNKFSKYEKQKRQLNFRSKLSCIIDPSHATYDQIGDMKFNKRSEWKKIKYIIFRTKQLLTCCICLNKEFIVPQMTFCGHVFCWHCILMHYEKSLKANSCPVCNQVFEIQELKTCDTLFLPPISSGDKIKLKLKIRKLDDKITYDPQTLQQQTDFSHIVRMKNANSLLRFNQEHQQILKEMQKNEDPQVQKYLIKVLEKSQKKIDWIKQVIEQEKGQHLKPHKRQTFVNGVLRQVLQPEDLSTEKIMMFYQQEEGRYVFLHPICQKYLRKNFNNNMLPLRIQQEVILKEETEYSGQNLKKYKYLNHLPDNQDFDFVFIKMNELIDYKLLEEFQKEFQTYKKKQHDIMEREEEYAKLLNEKYEKEQQYMRELKKMEQSEFHDIKVPTNMVDLSEIQDTNIFPSLVSTPSQSQSSVSKTETSKVSQVSSSSLGFGTSKKSKNNKFKLKEEDFPGLQLAIKLSMSQSPQKQIQLQQHIARTMSENPTSKHKEQEESKIKQQQSTQKKVNDFPEICNSSDQSMIIRSKKRDDEEENNGGKRKGKKKNKEKFVDVTHQFFQRQDDE